jgi:CubicO group peptidase (beta-lactamase class C family)
MLPVVSPCQLCSIPVDRIWIDSEHAIAFAADAPAAEGHIVVVPKERVPSIHALPIAVQKNVWVLLSDVRGRLRTGLTVQVVSDPVAAGNRVSAGSYGWDGAFGTHFWVDPKENVVGILMVQTDNPNRHLDRDFENTVMQAIEE